jgi:hypothetical protein
MPWLFGARPTAPLRPRRMLENCRH